MIIIIITITASQQPMYYAYNTLCYGNHYKHHISFQYNLGIGPSFNLITIDKCININMTVNMIPLLP